MPHSLPPHWQQENCRRLLCCEPYAENSVVKSKWSYFQFSQFFSECYIRCRTFTDHFEIVVIDSRMSVPVIKFFFSSSWNEIFLLECSALSQNIFLAADNSKECYRNEKNHAYAHFFCLPFQIKKREFIRKKGDTCITHAIPNKFSLLCNYTTFFSASGTFCVTVSKYTSNVHFFNRRSSQCPLFNRRSSSSSMYLMHQYMFWSWDYTQSYLPWWGVKLSCLLELPPRMGQSSTFIVRTIKSRATSQSESQWKKVCINHEITRVTSPNGEWRNWKF